MSKDIIGDTRHKEFLKDIVIKQNDEEKRLRKLKQLYDNREIKENEISDSDIDKLIEMYDKEIEELSSDTDKRKKHIKQVIKVEHK